MTANDQKFLAVTLELLQQGCAVKFCPSGQSMFPTIKDGETICVEPVAPETLKLGDIALYRFSQGVIAHRIKRICRQTDGTLSFVLRGDASHSDDQPITARDILGRVTAVEREGRIIKLTGGRARLRRRIRTLGGRLKRFLVQQLSNLTIKD